MVDTQLLKRQMVMLMMIITSRLCRRKSSNLTTLSPPQTRQAFWVRVFEVWKWGFL